MKIGPWSTLTDTTTAEIEVTVSELQDICDEIDGVIKGDLESQPDFVKPFGICPRCCGKGTINV